MPSTGPSRAAPQELAGSPGAGLRWALRSIWLSPGIAATSHRPPHPAAPAPRLPQLPLLTKDAEKSLRWWLGGRCCVCARNPASTGFLRGSHRRRQHLIRFGVESYQNLGMKLFGPVSLSEAVAGG